MNSGAMACPSCGAPLPDGTPAWVRSLTVGHVMTRNPVTLGPEDNLVRATEVMRLHGIRRIPVLVADAVVGLLVEGDLKRAQPSPLQGSAADYDRLMEQTPIAQIMIRDPLTVSDDLPLLEAARILHTTKYGALPVLRGEQLVGMLTDTDLSGCLVELLAQGG
jgi:acetoin utilization protein AcuB